MSFVLVSRNKQKAGSAPEVGPHEQEIQRRVQQELEQLRPSVQAEGMAAAEAVARAALQPLEAQFQHALSALEKANAQLAAPLAQKEHYLADLVLDMAFQLARHIVGTQVTQDQAPLLDLVKKLLEEAGSERTAQQNLTLRLSASDLPFVKDRLARNDVILIADESLRPGDALVELAADNADPLDRTEWDARLESRFEGLRQALLPAAGAVNDHA